MLLLCYYATGLWYWGRLNPNLFKIMQSFFNHHINSPQTYNPFNINIIYSTLPYHFPNLSQSIQFFIALLQLAPTFT